MLQAFSVSLLEYLTGFFFLLGLHIGLDLVIPVAILGRQAESDYASRLSGTRQGPDGSHRKFDPTHVFHS